MSPRKDSFKNLSTRKVNLPGIKFPAGDIIIALGSCNLPLLKTETIEIILINWKRNIHGYILFDEVFLIKNSDETWNISHEMETRRALRSTIKNIYQRI